MCPRVVLVHVRQETLQGSKLESGLCREIYRYTHTRLTLSLCVSQRARFFFLLSGKGLTSTAMHGERRPAQLQMPLLACHAAETRRGVLR